MNATSPQASPLAKKTVVVIGNDILNQLSIQAGGSQYTLSQVQVDDTTLTLVLQ